MMSYLESFSVTPLLYPAVQSLFDDVYNSGVMATIRQQHEHTTSPRVEVNATPGRTLFESHSLFWNRAVWVTRQLAHISTQHERTRELRRQLHEWANEMLVSSNVYVPVGPTHQKYVLYIHAYILINCYQVIHIVYNSLCCTYQCVGCAPYMQKTALHSQQKQEFLSCSALK